MNLSCVISARRSERLNAFEVRMDYRGEVTPDNFACPDFSELMQFEHCIHSTRGIIRSVPPRGLRIFDCRLPIANQETHPLPRGGTDFMHQA
jgi:hypothetical protein